MAATPAPWQDKPPVSVAKTKDHRVETIRTNDSDSEQARQYGVNAGPPHRSLPNRRPSNASQVLDEAVQATARDLGSSSHGSGDNHLEEAWTDLVNREQTFPGRIVPNDDPMNRYRFLPAYAEHLCLTMDAITMHMNVMLQCINSTREFTFGRSERYNGQTLPQLVNQPWPTTTILRGLESRVIYRLDKAIAALRTFVDANNLSENPLKMQNAERPVSPAFTNSSMFAQSIGRILYPANIQEPAGNLPEDEQFKEDLVSAMGELYTHCDSQPVANGLLHSRMVVTSCPGPLHEPSTRPRETVPVNSQVALPPVEVNVVQTITEQAPQ